MTEPTTQAGRALLVFLQDVQNGLQSINGDASAYEAEPDMNAAIAAIEAEAAEAARAEAVAWMVASGDYVAERDALAAENAALREIAERGVLARTYTVAGVTAYRDTSAKEDAEYLANPAAAASEWLREHDDAIREDCRKAWRASLDTMGRWIDLASPDAERRLAAIVAAWSAGDVQAWVEPVRQWFAALRDERGNK